MLQLVGGVWPTQSFLAVHKLAIPFFDIDNLSSNDYIRGIFFKYRFTIELNKYLVVFQLGFVKIMTNLFQILYIGCVIFQVCPRSKVARKFVEQVLGEHT